MIASSLDKKALRAAAENFIRSQGLRVIRGYALPVPNQTAKVFELDAKRGRATIEYHTSWDSTSRVGAQNIITRAKKYCSAKELGLNAWGDLSIEQKKAARAQWCGFDYKSIDL